jgi:hypothetical protein
MENPVGFVTLLEAVDLVGRAMYGLSWRPFQELGDERIPSNEELIEKEYLQPDARDDPSAVIWARWLFRLHLRGEVILSQTVPAIERVIYALAERCESGEIATSVRSITGADDLDCGVWRTQFWRRYFIEGIIGLSPPLLDGLLARPPLDFRQILVRRTDLERFIEKIASAPAPDMYAPVSAVMTSSAAAPAAPEKAARAAAQPKRRGAKAKYDWDDAFQYMHQILNERGDPLLPAHACEGWRSDADVGRAVQAYMRKHEKSEPDFKNLMKRIGPELDNWRNVGGDRGNVGIIRSPVRASIPPDRNRAWRRTKAHN